MSIRPGTAMSVVVCVVAQLVVADTAAAQSASRARPIKVQIDSIHNFAVAPAGNPAEDGSRRAQGGECEAMVSTHTDADFGGGVFIAQAGFEEGEIAAASYLLNPSDFPLQIDLMEMVFATINATVPTTTHWSVLVWEGTPVSGNLIAEFSSDGDLLPHIELPPGTNGVNVQVSVDPGDPEQIIVTDNGSHTFTIGYRIDQHNSPGTPCTSPPPSNQNAFPTTDVSGLSAPTQNWIFAVDGPMCICGSGWFTFQQFPAICTPSGDWIIRATWTSFDCGQGSPGACCVPAGDCFDITADECNVLDGMFQGEGTTCTPEICPDATVACCFEQTGGCIDVGPDDCQAAGGFPQETGSDCTSTKCFATGACCLPTGECEDGLSPDDCAAAAGVFQGSDSTCGDTDCPDPLGACCFDTGFCLPLTDADCAQAGASWQGPLTDCQDADKNGTADDCETQPCSADVNGDDKVNAADLALLLGNWGACPGCPTDLDGDDDVDAGDLALLLGMWGNCP